MCVFLSDFIDHEAFQITPGKTPPQLSRHTQLTSAVSCHVAHVSRDDTAVMCLVTQLITPGEVTVTSHHVLHPPPGVSVSPIISLIDQTINELLNQKTKPPAVQVQVLSC